MQVYADIYLLLNYCTCFGRPWRPSSGVHKTVVAASGTDRTIWGASFFEREQIRPYLASNVNKACSPDSTICTRGFKRDQIRMYLVTFEEACSSDSMICTRGFKRDQIRTYLVTFEVACSPNSMICTRGCNYSFMYS